MRPSYWKLIKEKVLKKIRRSAVGYISAVLLLSENIALFLYFGLKTDIAPAIAAGAILSVCVIIIIVTVSVLLSDRIYHAELLVKIYHKYIIGNIGKYSGMQSSLQKPLHELELPFRIEMNYKKLARNTVYTTAVTGKNIIAVSSVNPNEGKTFTAANLARFLAKEKYHVLLIDSDLRKPSLHNVFTVENKTGYSDFCIGKQTLSNCILKNVTDGLDLLTGGYAPPNAEELLSQKRITKEIEKLSELYDYILIDLPPMKICYDLFFYKDIIAGVIIVLKYGSTKYRSLFKCMKRIKKEKIHFLGFVMNFVDNNKNKESRK